MKLLIAGAHGQLGGEFVRRLAGSEHVVIAPAEPEFDIGDATVVQRIVAAANPDVIVNCAAYNFVDAAEDDPAPALRVNVDGVGILAAAARRAGIPIVHYGTDYVFDGEKESPYVETDEPSPINVYGRSKLEGERRLAAETNDYLLLRVSWVFGRGRQNFPSKLLEWTRGRDEIDVVDDEVSAPTSTEMIVDATMAALAKGLRGLYHFTTADFCSRWELADFFLRAAGRTVRAHPVGSERFPTKARRPRFSVLAAARFAKDAGFDLPSWREEIARFAHQKVDEETKALTHPSEAGRP